MAKEVQLANNSSSSGLTNGNLKKRTRHPTTAKQVNGNGVQRLSSMSVEEQFNAAVNVIQNLPKNGSFQPSDQMKLKFYALFKQAKEGPNTTPKPSFYEIVARYKWEAWAKLDQMPKETAMKSYVNELKQIVETMPYNDSVEEFYDKLGPFFEFKKEKPLDRRVNGARLNGGSTQLTRDANFSSSSDSSSESDDFSDTVDSLSANGDHSRSNDNHENHHEHNRSQFEDCTDENSKLKPGDLINAKGMDADYLTGQENYFYDCIDKNSVLNPNDIICARGETGIFSSRTNLPSSAEQTSSRASSFRQPLSIDNSGFRSQGVGQQGAGAGDGGDDRNFSAQHSELSDIHEHLALTVLRLQQTVKSISNRIESLEAKVNERQVEQSKKAIKKQAWWSNRTTQTTVLLILWPFAAHLIISTIKKKIANK